MKTLKEMVAIITIALLLTACASRNDNDAYWSTATPQIGKIVRGK